MPPSSSSNRSSHRSRDIEGTTFTIDEAKTIVLDGALIANRTADSHDILGTYSIVANPEEMSRTAANPDESIDLLRARHATLMGGRPEFAAAFKSLPNQAGMTLFVDPALVDGTLREGWRRLAELDTAWERSVYTMFLVSEVHRVEGRRRRRAGASDTTELHRTRLRGPGPTRRVRPCPLGHGVDVARRPVTEVLLASSGSVI